MTYPQPPTPGARAPLIGNAAMIPGVTAITSIQQKAPNILLAGQEKSGKSSTVVSLFGYPTPAHQPLILATDPSGPDSCLNMGYAVHAIHVHKQAGNWWWPKVRSSLEVIEKNIAAIRQTYGCIVVDDLSTISVRLLEDQRRISKNPDPRSHYFAMYGQMNELWWRIVDLDIPTVWLTWAGDSSLAENGELASPDIAGKKFARSIAGRAQHILLLEKRFIGKTQPGADQHGYGRLFHTVPWAGMNAGGRLSHVLPEPMVADLGLVLRLATGMTEPMTGAIGAPGAAR